MTLSDVRACHASRLRARTGAIADSFAVHTQ